MQPAQLQYLNANSTYDAATHVLFSAPLDQTVSFFPGTRFAGSSIREVSQNLEIYSPYLNCSLDQLSIHDAGELELPQGNLDGSLEIIHNYVAQLLQSSKKPIMIGGEHLVTLSSIKAFKEIYPSFILLQLDAHADLRETYQGALLSHATVMRRCIEFSEVKQLYQLGIRSGTKKEFDWMKHNQSCYTFESESLEELFQNISNQLIYITVDLDVFDPAFLPGTSTPEPGGIDFHTFIKFIKKLQHTSIIGMDIVELNPLIDSSKSSSILAAKVIRELLLCFK